MTDEELKKLKEDFKEDLDVYTDNAIKFFTSRRDSLASQYANLRAPRSSVPSLNALAYAAALEELRLAIRLGSYCMERWDVDHKYDATVNAIGATNAGTNQS